MTEYKITNRITKKIINEVIEVKDKQGLTAQNIVSKATNKKSNLHDWFEWDNKLCGEQWRLHQARILINEIKVIVENKEYYAFENITINIENKQDSNKREYHSYDDILDNKELRKQILERALNSIIYWKKQHQNYSEFNGIFTEIEKIETKLND